MNISFTGLYGGSVQPRHTIEGNVALSVWTPLGFMDTTLSPAVALALAAELTRLAGSGKEPESDGAGTLSAPGKVWND
jgi:hypothetical protein